MVFYHSKQKSNYYDQVWGTMAKNDSVSSKAPLKQKGTLVCSDTQNTFHPNF